MSMEVFPPCSPEPCTPLSTLSSTNSSISSPFILPVPQSPTITLQHRRARRARLGVTSTIRQHLRAHSTPISNTLARILPSNRKERGHTLRAETEEEDRVVTSPFVLGARTPLEFQKYFAATYASRAASERARLQFAAEQARQLEHRKAELRQGFIPQYTGHLYEDSEAEEVNDVNPLRAPLFRQYPEHYQKDSEAERAKRTLRRYEDPRVNTGVRVNRFEREFDPRSRADTPPRKYHPVSRPRGCNQSSTRGFIRSGTRSLSRSFSCSTCDTDFVYERLPLRKYPQHYRDLSLSGSEGECFVSRKPLQQDRDLSLSSEEGDCFVSRKPLQQDPQHLRDDDIKDYDTDCEYGEAKSSPSSPRRYEDVGIWGSGHTRINTIFPLESNENQNGQGPVGAVGAKCKSALALLLWPKKMLAHGIKKISCTQNDNKKQDSISPTPWSNPLNLQLYNGDDVNSITQAEKFVVPPHSGEDSNAAQTEKAVIPPHNPSAIIQAEKAALPPNNSKDANTTQDTILNKTEQQCQRKLLRESGDFLGVQGANPRTGLWDTSAATSSTLPSQMNEETKKALLDLKIADLEKKQKSRGRWFVGENGWSSIAEPSLNPVEESLGAGRSFLDGEWLTPITLLESSSAAGQNQTPQSSEAILMKELYADTFISTTTTIATTVVATVMAIAFETLLIFSKMMAALKN